MTKYKVYITDSKGTRELEVFDSLTEATIFMLETQNLLPDAKFDVKVAQ